MESQQLFFHEEINTPTDSKKAKEEKRRLKEKKEWTDEEVGDFIDMLEQNPCLWDVYDKTYSKRDVRELAYTALAERFETSVPSIKTKINGLRAQLGREMANEKYTKSGQSTDELYRCSWIHLDRLQFMRPVIGASKSRDTMTVQVQEEEVEQEECVTPIKSFKRKSLAEKKLDLLSRCTDAVNAGSSKKSYPETTRNNSNFALYVDEKLCGFNKRNRMLAENKINDILFDFEMSEITSNAQGDYVVPTYTDPRVPIQSYMSMLTNIK